jgi:hypothetical protein
VRQEEDLGNEEDRASQASEATRVAPAFIFSAARGERVALHAKPVRALSFFCSAKRHSPGDLTAVLFYFSAVMMEVAGYHERGVQI